MLGLVFVARFAGPLALLTLNPQPLPISAGVVDLVQHRAPVARPERSSGFRTSLLPGEEQFEPLVPAKPLTVPEAREVEARKQLVLGYMYLDQRKLREARRAFEIAVENDPKSLPALRELTQVCVRLRQFDDAIKYCRRALQFDPENYRLLQLYGFHCFEKGDVADAVGALERAYANPQLRRQDGDSFIRIRELLARIYAQQKNQPARIRALRDIIDVIEHPESSDLTRIGRRMLKDRTLDYYQQLGRALAEAGKDEEAIAILERGRRAGGTLGQRLSLDLARLHAERGNYQKALEHLGGMLDVQNREALELYKQVLTKLGRGGELLSRLEKALAKDRHDSVLRLFFAEELLAAKRYDDAEKQLLQLPTRSDVLLALAELYRQKNQPAKLLETMASALQKSSRGRAPDSEAQQEVLAQIKVLANDPELLKQLAKLAREKLSDESLQFHADYVVAEAARKADDLALTKEFYERCIQAHPDRLGLYFDLLRVLWPHQQHADLVDLCSRAIERQPGHPGLSLFYEFKARGLEMLGHTEQAVKVVDKLLATSSDPAKTIEAKLLCAWIYLHAKDYTKAEAVCAKLLEQFPDAPQLPSVRYLLANVLTLQERLDKAEEQLLKVVDLDPQLLPDDVRRDWAGANNDLGYLWADEGKNLERAEAMIRNALKERPESAAYLDSLGWVLFKRSKFAEAVKYLEKATQAESGTDAVIWDHLGDAYLQVQNRKQARKAWEKSIQLYKKKDDLVSKDAEKIEQLTKKIKTLDEPASNAPVKRASESGP